MAKVCPNQLRHLRNESHSKITNTKNSTFNPIYSTYIDFILHFFPDFFFSIHKLQRSGLYQNPYYQPSAKSIFTCQIGQQNCLTGANLKRVEPAFLQIYTYFMSYCNDSNLQWHTQRYVPFFQQSKRNKSTVSMVKNSPFKVIQQDYSSCVEQSLFTHGKKQKLTLLLHPFIITHPHYNISQNMQKQGRRHR